MERGQVLEMKNFAWVMMCLILTIQSAYACRSAQPSLVLGQLIDVEFTGNRDVFSVHLPAKLHESDRRDAIIRLVLTSEHDDKESIVKVVSLERDGQLLRGKLHVPDIAGFTPYLSVRWARPEGEMCAFRFTSKKLIKLPKA